MSGKLVRLLRRLAVLPIRCYQRCISPFTPPTCRFHPTCSEYARQAILVHGVWRGGWLALRRILRCHPFCEGGADPVPPSRARRLAEGDEPQGEPPHDWPGAPPTG